MRTKVLPWTKENVNRYKSGDNLLRHAKTGPDIQGKILVGTQGDLIGYIAWSPDYIVALEVSPKYRGQGIATKLLEECPVKRLTVSCSNLGAIKLYKDLGYQVYKREPKILYMKKTYRVKRFSKIFQKEFGLAQRYFRNKKNQRSFSTIGKLLRRGLAGATKSPGAAAGAVVGAGGSVVGTAIHPGWAAFPSVSLSTAFGRKFGDAFLPRRIRLGLEKTSRRMKVNPENYEAAGLPVPKASRVAANLERWVDKSRVGRFFNPRLKILQESKAAKKIKKTTEKVHRQIGSVSSGLQRGLSVPTTGMAVTHP